MLTAKEEARLRELAKEMNKILERSDRPSFYNEPPQYKYDKKDGFRLRGAMEKRLQEIADSGTIPTRVEMSSRTEWLMGLDSGSSRLIFVENKNETIPYDDGYTITYLSKYSLVDIVVRRDIHIPEGSYDVFAEEKIK